MLFEFEISHPRDPAESNVFSDPIHQNDFKAVASKVTHSGKFAAHMVDEVRPLS